MHRTRFVAALYDANIVNCRCRDEEDCVARWAQRNVDNNAVDVTPSIRSNHVARALHRRFVQQAARIVVAWGQYCNCDCSARTQSCVVPASI